MARPAYKNPTQKINEQYMVIDMNVKALQNSMMLKLKEAKTSFVKETAKLDSLSPLKTLTSGYSIVTEQDGKIINPGVVFLINCQKRWLYIQSH